MIDTNFLLPYLGAALLFTAIGYVYFGLALSTLARKTGTPNGWMAWVPLLNMYLLCRIGGRSGAYFLLLLIPLVNIVAAIILWMDIARARGKSPALGLLILVPVVNIFVPWILASGPPSVPAAAGGAPGSPAAQGPAVCPACGRTECLTEEFCGYTGKRIAGLAATPPASAAPAAEPKPGIAAKVIVGLLLLVGVGYFALGLLSTGKKALTAAQMPARTAGTLTEFPVDPAPVPTKPTSVSSRDLRAPSSTVPKLPPNSLPPGLPESRLPQIGNSMTTATYQTRPGDPPVVVHVIVLDSAGISLTDGIGRAVASASGTGDLTGVRVQSPGGGSYQGHRVRTASSVAYILQKIGSAILILIYAPDASVKEVADRLALSVGNGQGLNEDPAVLESLTALPAEVPGGMQLADTDAYSGDNLTGSLDQLKSALGRDFGPEAMQWIEPVRPFIPSRLTLARYVDTSRSEFKLAVGDYGGFFKAWTTWQLLRATLGLAGMTSIPLSGGDALSTVDGGQEYVIFRRGGCLGVISGPAAQSGRMLLLAQAVRQ